MRVDVKVPPLSESITEGTLLEWRKAPGAQVARDETLVDLETDKVILDVPAPASGTLAEILRPDGTVVKPGEVIARVETEAGTATASAPVAAGVAAAEAPAVRVPGPQVAESGRAEKAAAAAAPFQAPPASLPPIPDTGRGRPERRERMTRLRRAIAERLVEAQRTAAMLTTFNEVNMQPVQELRAKHKESFEREHGVRLGLMSFFVKAVVAALKQYPVLNASLDGDEIVYHDYHDIGIAVSSERGLVVPVLRDADCLGFADIERRIADFAARAGTLTLALEDLAGGTFTLTNGGVFGSMLSTPILNPPQSAILGMHRIMERPVAEDGQVVIRPMMYLALSYDHRLVDGRDAVLFLRDVKESLEDPGRLMLAL